MKATKEEAWVKSRLDFYKVPAWMKQWPFAHTVDMTYRLKDGVLEVLTEVTNLANEPMPLVIGYHPHFTLTDSKRDEWTASIAAKKHYLLSPQKLPTGETEPIEKFAADPQAVSVRDHDLDDVFGDLVRDAQGRATFTVKGKTQKLDVDLRSRTTRSRSSGPRSRRRARSATSSASSRWSASPTPSTWRTRAPTVSCSRLRRARPGARAGG